MRAGALAPYEASLRDRGELALVGEDGSVLALDVRRWLDDVDAADATVLDRCTAPTLDLGAGPGRMVRALAARGVAALGVDIAATAVALSNERGGTALVRDVFDRLPAEGRWPTVLLIDGNVGIGGDVDRLLRRVAGLLAADGRLVVETAADDRADAVWQARFARSGTTVGPTFPWAQVGRDVLVARAAAYGLVEAARWAHGRRRFVELRPAGQRLR